MACYSLVFDVNGDVYFPCRDFIGCDEYRIGSIYREVDLGRLRQVMEQVDVARRPACQGCWANTMCGGTCYNAAFLCSGQIVEPDRDLCEVTRYLGMRALQLVVNLHNNQPSLLAELIEFARAHTPWAPVGGTSE